MESVYLETSFISYLVARPSRDVIVAGHQQTTQEWWDNRRSQFECSVSQVVIDEASAGALAPILSVNPAAGVALAVVRKVRNLSWAAIGLVLVAMHPTNRRSG